LALTILLAVCSSLRAQTDGLVPVSPDDVPPFGTFYSTQFRPPLPYDWAPALAVYSLGSSNNFIIDDSSETYPVAEGSGAMGRPGGGRTMDDAPWPGDGDIGTNSPCDGTVIYGPAFTTNDLWLQITGTTNAGTNWTAFLVIHPPWDVTNGVYDLWFTTNLAIAADWSWLLATTPGQTNLAPSNLPPAQAFFALGPRPAVRLGFTNNIIGPNDDDSYYYDGFYLSYEVTNLLATVGFSVNFFGTSFTNLYVNNNGNVTFV
jgi:hypothetical protein